jgi:hypothetical protein
MDDLNKALGEISSIRQQVARSTQFHGYGPATLAATSAIAVMAAGLQALWVPDPANHIFAYLGVWIPAAIVSAAVIGFQMVTRTHRMHSGMADEMIRTAVEQFLPSAGAGVLLTTVIAVSVPSAQWMLPGLWQIIFSLGVFSSGRFLPQRMPVAGAWYLLAGLTGIMLDGNRALSPWTMGIAYGGGQLLVAGILYNAARECGHESEG